MFTGIVEQLGTVAAVDREDTGGRTLEIRSAYEPESLEIGESIAVDGVCLTVSKLGAEEFEVDLSPETLQRSTLSEVSAGEHLHLERALRVGDRLGGHFVQGHVDGVGEVSSQRREGDGWRVVIDVPNGLDRYLVEKGSVAVDGVSLTVAERSGSSFAVAIVPHTDDVTKFGDISVGTAVNIEVDMLGKYVERLMQTDETDT